MDLTSSFELQPFSSLEEMDLEGFYQAPFSSQELVETLNFETENPETILPDIDEFNTSPMVLDMDTSRNQDLMQYIQVNQESSVPNSKLVIPEVPSVDFDLEKSDISEYIRIDKKEPKEKNMNINVNIKQESDYLNNKNSQEFSNDIKVNQKSKKSIRKYNWNNITVTGKKLAKTQVYRSEPEGRCECSLCGIVFTHNRSLEVHMMRKHNPKATMPCPEKCGKFFTNKAAIKKHLLSHKPENEWPFACLLCGKHFQALGDLPKHYLSRLHAKDPRVPIHGTPEWNEIMKKSKVEKNFKNSSPQVLKPILDIESNRRSDDTLFVFGL